MWKSTLWTLIASCATFISYGQEMEHMMMPRMNGAVLLTDTMSQEGSGTSWIPASTPMHAMHWINDEWTFMLHGNVVLRYTRQGGPRGVFSSTETTVFRYRLYVTVNSSTPGVTIFIICSLVSPASSVRYSCAIFFL